jgi:hypothetical protein
MNFGVPNSEKALTTAAADLDARIAVAFAEDAESGAVRCVLADVEAAAKVAEAAAEAARCRALDPLVADVIFARRAMDDAAFKRDRLTEAAKRLAARVDELKALEKARAERAEHGRVSAERERLAAELERMAEAIMRTAHLVSKIAACDREIGRLNATTALQHGHIPLVLTGAAPAIRTLFEEALVWDAFIAVARLPSKAA